MIEHGHRSHSAPILAGIQRPPRVRAIKVVAVAFTRGEGCCEDDPVREVIAYFTPGDKLLAENDPHPTEVPS